MPHIERFVFYSFILHSALVGSLILNQFAREGTKAYYAVDFYGGGPSHRAADLTAASSPPKEQAPKEEPVKEKIINPKEDLLIKSKKKEKKVKEVISTVPAIPIPKPLPKEDGGASAAPSAIPGAADGSGVGVGFGADGWKGGSGGAGNFPYQWYVQIVKKKLDANWNVSEGSSRRIYAQAAFTIERNGGISDVKIEEPSGNDVFDLQARRAVEASGPLPPLPRDFHESTLRVHVRFTVKR